MENADVYNKFNNAVIAMMYCKIRYFGIKCKYVVSEHLTYIFDINILQLDKLISSGLYIKSAS